MSNTTRDKGGITMKKHCRFWARAVSLIFVGLLVALLPDWGVELRAQTLSPTSVNFGNVPVGATGRQNVTFTNTRSGEFSKASSRSRKSRTVNTAAGPVAGCKFANTKAACSGCNRSSAALAIRNVGSSHASMVVMACCASSIFDIEFVSSYPATLCNRSHPSWWSCAV